MEIKLPQKEIDIGELIKKLIESKTTILISTLIITILTAIYSFQKPIIYSTSGLINIGSTLEISNGVETKSLIETSKTLISDLKINFIYSDKFIDKEIPQDQLRPFQILFNSENDHLVEIITKSDSLETNESLMNLLTEFVIKRHENMMFNINQNALNQQSSIIDQIDAEILLNREYFNSKIENQLLNELSSTESTIANIEVGITNLEKEINYYQERGKTNFLNKINAIQSSLVFVSKKIEVISRLIEDEKRTLSLLAKNPTELVNKASIFPTLDEIISNYENVFIDLNALKINLEDELVTLNDNFYSEDMFFLKKLSLENKMRDQQALLNSQQKKLSLFMSPLEDKNSIGIGIKYDDSDIVMATRRVDLLIARGRSETQLKLLRKKIPINSYLISNFKTQEEDNRSLVIALGFVLGLILNVFIVLFKYYLGIIKKNHYKTSL